MKPTIAAIVARCAAVMLLTLLLGCSSSERRVVYVRSSMGVQGVDPSAPPRTLSIDFLIFKIDNLIVLDRHPEVRLRLWACGQHLTTRVAQWEPEVGWPEDRFVFGPDCSSSSNVVIGLENADNGHYLAVAKMSLGEMLHADPLELAGVGGKIYLDVQTYGLPGTEEPRKVPLSVPASRPLDELVGATIKSPKRTQLAVEGWQAIPVAEGDTIQIRVGGRICRSDECFGPEGLSTFFGLMTNYRLLARIGPQLEYLDRERSFVSQYTGDLLLYVDDAGPVLRGAYDATIEINANPAGGPSDAGRKSVARSLTFQRTNF